MGSSTSRAGAPPAGEPSCLSLRLCSKVDGEQEPEPPPSTVKGSLLLLPLLLVLVVVPPAAAATAAAAAKATDGPSRLPVAVSMSEMTRHDTT